MKYMLLIHHGDMATPNDSEEWAKLSKEEQKAVYADYKAIDQTEGVTPGLRLEPRRWRPRFGWRTARL